MFSRLTNFLMLILALCVAQTVKGEDGAQNNMTKRMIPVVDGKLPDEIARAFRESLDRPSSFDKAGNDPLPPWLAYPHIPKISIGWRMGDGETYLHEFEKWFITKSKEIQERYTIENSEPEDWEGFYSNILANEKSIRERERI